MSEDNMGKVLAAAGGFGLGILADHYFNKGPTCPPVPTANFLQFNGIDTVVNVTTPIPIIGLGTTLTIEAWVVPDLQTSGNYLYHKDIIRSQCGNNNTNNGLWGISTAGDFNTSQLLIFQVGWITGNGNDFFRPSNAICPIGVESFIKLMLDRTTGKAQFWRDGNLIAEQIFPVGTKPTTNGFSVGNECGGPFKGRIRPIIPA